MQRYLIKVDGKSASKEIFLDQGFKMFEQPIISTILEVSKAFKLTGSINIVQMWMNIILLNHTT